MKCFIYLPAIGLAFVPLGEDGVQVSAIYFQLNIYTAPGFLGATLALLNVVFVLVFFREHVNIVAVPDSDSLTPSIQVTGGKCSCSCYIVNITPLQMSSVY